MTHNKVTRLDAESGDHLESEDSGFFSLGLAACIYLFCVEIKSNLELLYQNKFCLAATYVKVF